MPQSFTHMDAGTQPICLTVELAEEVLDSLQWVVDDWDNMDADDRLTHRGYLNAYNSILDQLPIHKDTPTYPEPEGCPSY